MYREAVCSPRRGKMLSHITDEVETQVEALRMKLRQCELESRVIDVLVLWSGNEPTGYYGVFLDPGFNEDDYIWQNHVQNWPDGTPKTLHTAQGNFPDIAKCVCRCLDKLSSLRDKPYVGFVALNGNVRHDLFSMPVQYNEVMDMFWKHANRHPHGSGRVASLPRQVPLEKRQRRNAETREL